MTLEQQDKKYVLQTYARDYTNFVKGVGSTLYDESGKDYRFCEWNRGKLCRAWK